jgi:hypothetical protein
MMYTFSNRLRNLAIAFMVIGFLGLVYGFFTAPKTIEEAKAIVAASAHGDEHGASHDDASAEAHHDTTDAHATDASHESHAAEEEGHEMSHDEHVFHQLSNKPWAALYVAAFFFFMIALGTLAFYAIQRAAQAGWSPVLYRVMEGITAYLLPGGLIVIAILILSSMHFNHLFIWMDPEVVAHDKLIAGKTGFLNTPFFLIRAFIFLTGWNFIPLLFPKIFFSSRRF